MDEYDFSYRPELDLRRVRDPASLAFVEARANAALLGSPGVGKIHIALALAVAACRAGFTIYFTTLDGMVRQLKAADAIGRLGSELRRDRSF
ncbi:ATP-binding protein [Streptosporangium sp. CA-135522]|uniref:ATP-binding protein n=1 Tax=Streptosporangium sp. CA-135522 TaxID=3240072 RepID=UPI003D8D329A